MIAGQPILFLPWWSDTIVYLQTEAAKLWIHWPQPFFIDLRERNLEYWHLILKLIQENTTASALLITNGELFLQKEPGHSFALHFPKYMFLNLPCDVIRSSACFRLCVHTLRFQTATWNHSYSPTCDLHDTDDAQDEQHVLFHCANPQVISLRRYIHL
jgi:hypothetical protein